MQKFVKSLYILVLALFILSACQVSSSSKVSVNVNGENVIDAKSGFDSEDPNLFSVDVNTSKYSRIDFGSQKGKPISWYIVGDDDEHLILMSEKVLDVQKFDVKEKVASYMDSSLYEYLNTDFVNTTFSEDERAKMVFVNDKDNCLVTLPSIDNLIDLYGDMNYLKDGYYGAKDFFAANKDIIAKPTQVAIDNDIDVFDNKVFAEILQTDVDDRYEFANGSVPYWILNVDEETGYSLNVTSTGYVALNDANTNYIGIRLIIRIKK
ncbi:MAG: hypothetical protein IKP66_08750 [Lachnospiraceae bacterium]|nr:hypothetical protein [Lachnospiraceae bacterium]